MAVWLFLTPVIFPTPTTGLFATLVRLNPVTPLLVTVRELTIAPGAVSNPLGFGWASGLALVLVLVGWLVYRITMPFVIERMSA
jgi:lipopolysaccharide transport system permease protein